MHIIDPHKDISTITVDGTEYEIRAGLIGRSAEFATNRYGHEIEINTKVVLDANSEHGELTANIIRTVSGTITTTLWMTYDRKGKFQVREVPANQRKELRIALIEKFKDELLAYAG